MNIKVVKLTQKALFTVAEIMFFFKFFFMLTAKRNGTKEIWKNIKKN